MVEAQDDFRLADPRSALLPDEVRVLQLDSESVDVGELYLEAAEVGAVVVIGRERGRRRDGAEVVERPEVELQRRLQLRLAALEEGGVDGGDRDAVEKPRAVGLESLDGVRACTAV